MRSFQSEHLVWYLKRIVKDLIEKLTGKCDGKLLCLILISLYVLTYMKKFLKNSITARDLPDTRWNFQKTKPQGRKKIIKN